MLDTKLSLAVEYCDLINKPSMSLSIYNKMWRNIQKNGGTRLTSEGFEYMKQLNKPFNKVTIDPAHAQKGKVLVGLDKLIKSPYYIYKNEFYIFDNMTVVGIILYDSNLENYIESQL